MRPLLLLVWILACSQLAGCASKSFSLTANCFPQLQRPNSMVESFVWEQTPSIRVPLTTEIGLTGETKYATIRAAHDSRVLSILIRRGRPNG